MELGSYDIEKIYRVMYGIAKKCVPYVYTSERPSSTSTSMTKFIAVSIPTRTENFLALGETTAKFQIFVKDDNRGLEDCTTFSTIQKGMYAQLPYNDGVYLFSSPVFQHMGSDGKGFHVYNITTSLTIL